MTSLRKNHSLNTHIHHTKHTCQQNQTCRAVQADNYSVLLKLLDEFKASPLVVDPKSGENILHTACRMKSELRFFIANRYPDLLKKRNLKASAEQPLHIAWSKNDISFVSWLFKNILAQESAMDAVFGVTVNDSRPRNESFATVTVSKAKPVVQPVVHSKIRPQQSWERRMTDHDIVFSPKRPSLQAISSRDAQPEASEIHPATPGEQDGGLSFSFDGVKSESVLPSLSLSIRNPQRMKLDEILQESPLTISEVYHLLPSLTSNGDSVFHILARENCPELLTRMFKVAEFVHWRINLNMLFARYRLDSYLPLEEAIRAKNIECARIILHFMSISGLLRELLHDQRILYCAVHTAELDAVKVLISYGFHKGLQLAISRAIEIQKDEILRVLLYYQTEVINALEFSHITQNQVRALHHSNGGIKWEGFGLRHIDPLWVYDCYSAVDCVSKACSLIPVLLSADDNHHFFQQLGRDCLQFFNVLITSPLSGDPYQHLSVITKVNLSKNRLAEVPVELFQLPSLSFLQLSSNKLKSLPFSTDASLEVIYTAPISSLDLSHNHLRMLPECLFRDLAHTLTELNASCNIIEDLPPGLWICPKLKKLKLGHNSIAQLHALSSPQYFDKPELSSAVITSFTVVSGALVCNSPTKSKDLCEIEEYMHRLANFQCTVCAVKFPLNSSLSNCKTKMCDLMDIHLSRIEFYQSSSSGHHPRTASTPTLQGEALFTVNNGEEVESSTCVLEELDLSHNSFSQFPWDITCIAPQLKKLLMQGNKIEGIDIVHSVPKDLESLNLDKNLISDLLTERPKSLPCGHPFRLLTLPENMTSHDRYCRHCKHESLESLLLLSASQNLISVFPTMQQNPKASQMSEPLYPNLSILTLENNKLQNFPMDLHHLTKLSSVKLSHNDICELPPEAGLLNAHQLYILKLDGMNIRNIPPHLLQNRTPRPLLNYLKAIQQK